MPASEHIVQWSPNRNAIKSALCRFRDDRVSVRLDCEWIKPRPPRYQCALAATIANNDIHYLCQVIDISTSGLKIHSPVGLRCGDIVMVKVEGLSPHKAKVIWLDDDHYGLKLQNSYSFDEIRARLMTGIPLSLVGRS